MKSLLLLVLLFSEVSHGKTLTVVSEEWEDSTHKDGGGLFFDIVRAVYLKPAYLVKTSIYPYKRAIEMVKKEAVDLALGPYKEELSKKHFQVPEIHLFVDDIKLIYHRQKFPKKPKGMSQITRKKLGWQLGYGYDKYFKEKVSFTEFKSMENIPKILKKGKGIDFFIAPEALIDDALFPSAEFAQEHLMWIRLFPVFQQNPQGVKLAAEWDRNMKAMIADGRLLQLYKKWKLEDYYLYGSSPNKTVH